MENPNEPAFPFATNSISPYVDNQCFYGLTKREYFAAMAMQGFLSSKPGTPPLMDLNGFSKSVIKIADAVLAQLAEK